MRRLQQQFHALGSQAYITLIADEAYLFDELFMAIHNKIMAFESRFSRFLPQTELTKFNEHAGNETKISEAFRKLLLTSQQMAAATGDIYNPFVLPALQQAGYKGSWPSPSSLAGAKDFSSRKVVSAAELKISEETARIPAGTALDFGGIGKGYLLDELSYFLQTAKLHGYCLSLGGDIVCAGYDLGEVAWSIQVQPAINQGQTVAALTNKTAKPLFIATSGVTKRHGDTGSGTWHHIINPQTGQPATTDILTVTVTSDSGVKADVYAKTIIIAGREQATILKQAGHIRSFILQYQDRVVTRLE